LLKSVDLNSTMQNVPEKEIT